MRRALGVLGTIGLAMVVFGGLVSACDDGRRSNNESCEADDECGSGFCLVVCLDPEGDVDGDGLINGLEKALATRADAADTDGDGVNDSTEVGSDTRNPRDTDGDGVIDALESDIADADGDCISDQQDATSETHAQLVAVGCATVGVCASADASAVVLTCPGGLDGKPPVCDYSGVAGYAAADSECDGIDADCSGETDEDFVSAACEAKNTFGTCSGKTTCGAGALGCDAREPAGEVCDGIDQDCNGETDESTCDDGNACTEDVCSGSGGCQNTAKSCDDGDACTTDICDSASGDCVNEALDCDDGDACTADTCDASTGTCVNEALDCDDGDACTVDACDAASGVCTHEALDCDDQDACTTDSCSPESGGCEHVAAVCDDLDGCTTDSCDPASGQCASVPVSCDDLDPCTTDTCEPDGGLCVHTAGVCDDGDACTTDTCDSATGACSNAPVECDLGACVVAACDTALGCVAASEVQCDDEDACTTDTCDDEIGCVYEPVDCDDGDVCNGAETCDSSDGCLAAQSVSYFEDFNGEIVGWETGVLDPSLEPSNTWTVAWETGGSDPVAFDSPAYGTINNGDQAGFEQSYLLSPVYDLTGGAVVTFRTFVSNEGGLGEGGEGPLSALGEGEGNGSGGPLTPDDAIEYNGYDMEFFQVSLDGGETWRQLLPPGSAVWLTQETPDWVDVSVSIPTSAATANSRFRFVYDTGDSCCGPEAVIGWFIDDFLVTVGGPLVCDGTDLCVSTSCDAVAGCQVAPLELDCDDDDLCTVDFCHPEIACVNTSIEFQCDDNDACNGAESCISDIGCTPALADFYQDGFEFDQESNWYASSIDEGDSSYWIYTGESGGDAPIVFDSQVFGTPNAGAELGVERSGVYFGPSVDLSNGGRFRFRSFTANEDWNIDGRDGQWVEYSVDGGETWSVLIDPSDPRWVESGSWVQFDATFTPAEIWENVTFRFVYDTVDDCCGPNDVAGWFLDDIQILTYQVFSCDDGDPCTIDSCDSVDGCSHEPDVSCTF
ncbi:MAG: hypothetical protein R3F39_04560 [Myxococcota bacterium]